MPEQRPCRSCGAPLLWVYTVAGNLMPLDAEPNEKGYVVLVDGKAHTIRNDLFDAMLPEGPRYMPHHATCPNAAQHRRQKRP